MENLILLEQLKMDTNPFHFSLEKRWHDSWFHWRIRKLSFGDKAILFIPSHLAYGAGGAGDVIPPNTMCLK
jgi:FKBP-type peptidyl-prolyl cis-trans isomerase